MVEILTLGNWDIKHKGISILESKGYQEKLLNLFKYLLLFKDQKLNPDKIIDDLYGDKDYYDPRKTLRTQISRVRYMFSYNDFFSIEFVAGYYIFKLVEETRVDFERFEELLNKSNSLMDSNQERAMEYIKEGLSLYNGELLEIVDDSWIMPMRIRYNRIYTRSIYNYLKVLKAENNYRKILEVSERAITYHPYEELLNIYYLESLGSLGQREHAISHYEYFTNILYNDLQLAPSNELLNTYNKIKNINTGEKNVVKPKSSEKEREFSQFNLELFNTIYSDDGIDEENIHEKGNYYIMLSINFDLYCQGSTNQKLSMDTLYDIASQNIRKEDVILRDRDSNIILILYDISYFVVGKIMERLEKNFKEKNQKCKLNIKIKSQSTETSI